ncbi:DUF3426 domain-containing protein [Pseudomonas sp. N040]|uniref:DUF3426 domain-containing protein n=1 Tax=Pseudomonas sp. N040 TaxID=2785325 RepID=UPI0018A2BC5C|nr:DUF3426 domain-containing protein [Pseudomonas sp. N040]MBF7731057.1 DUF3426 domain-containing protein [Pseudomonas sp. N040]MBW7014700.1 DUF3426 domain-containing protein [Pseudomonas sp. N040]
MTDSFVTQCPHCRTSFRVSSSQLGAAHGAVRCGACLHVFNAHQHLLNQPAGASTAATAGSVPQRPAGSVVERGAKVARQDPLDHVRIHDDLDLDSLDLDSLDLDEELARLEELEQQLEQASLTLAAPAAVAAPEQEHHAARHSEESAQPVRSQPAAVAPSAAATQRREPALAEPAPAEPTPEQTAPAEDAEPPATAAAVEEIELTITDSESRAASTFRRQQNLFELSDDPLHLEWQAPRKPWGRWLGWGLLSLLAAGALLGQYTLYHFDELARQDKYRPWFAAACLQLGCTLPTKVDVSLIKSSNLVVRSHPDFAGALVVDAIIYNRASFAQPFPLLELRFSDLNNQLLANRRFKPSEYLSGELAGQDEMPPQTPIHISLDILDPGPQAVNYSLDFKSPE